MIRNVGTFDRTVCPTLDALFVIDVGSYVGLFSLGFGPVPVAPDAAFIAVTGAVLLVTRAGRISPLYLPFGIDTFGDRD